MSDSRPLELEEEAKPASVFKNRSVQLILLAAAAVIVFVVFRGNQKAPPAEPDERPASTRIAAVVPYTPVDLPPAAPPAPTPQPLPAFVAPAIVPAAIVKAATPGVTASAPKSSGAMLSFPVSSLGHADAGRGPAGAPNAPVAAETTIAFKGAAIPGARASSAIDSTFMLMPGLLPMVLDTAINSNVPDGPVLAHLTGPVYSPKGVLLMEADTQIIGRYSGLKQGSERLNVNSLWAHTPNDIWVPLADGFSDDLGRAGLAGNVDNRYVERFGAAILLTLTQSALQILQTKQQQTGGNTYLQLGGGDGVGNLANTILQHQIDLPPIFSKNPGETVAVFLTSPIDFSRSYKLRTGP